MASPLISTWVFATVRIENPQNESGSGFLVYRLHDENEGSVFLVTNKHVVHRDDAERENVAELACHFNTDDPPDGTLCLNISTRDQAGELMFRQHPDPDVDVLAFNITAIFNQYPNLRKKWVGYEMFGDAAKRDELDITAGEEVITLGYPLGLRQGDTNRPLIRQGLIATTIGTILRDSVPDGQGGTRERALRGFLIDGATVPGSSGSPVVLKPVIGRVVGGTIRMGTAPPVLLGIVAETRYAPIEMQGLVTQGFAGLGLAFDVETVQETIELFFPPESAT